MTPQILTLVIFTASLFAGFLGSMTGLGGGVVITPVLTLLLGVDIRYAIGASLISVIATSSGAAAAYVRDGLSNIRVGMFLEIATTVGALFGAFLALFIQAKVLTVVFGVIMLQAAWQTVRARKATEVQGEPDPLSKSLKLEGEYLTPEGKQRYQVFGVKPAFGVMFGAGTISGLLGIGSGAFKVIAMDQLMKLPFRVSTATSNFMIGVTAAASAGVYFSRGYVQPTLATPVMLGVLVGSMIGAKVINRVPVKQLRIAFAIVVAVAAIQMMYTGLRGGG